MHGPRSTIHGPRSTLAPRSTIHCPRPCCKTNDHPFSQGNRAAWTESKTVCSEWSQFTLSVSLFCREAFVWHWHTLFVVWSANLFYKCTKCDSQNVTHKMWHTKCDSQNVTHKMWLTKCDPQNVTHKMWPTKRELTNTRGIKLCFTYAKASRRGTRPRASECERLFFNSIIC